MKEKIMWAVGGICLMIITVIDGFLYAHLTNKFGFDLGFALLFALSIFIGFQIVNWLDWGEKFAPKRNNKKDN